MIIAANFKTNKTRKETIDYLNELKKIDLKNITVRVFPPSTAFIEDEFIGAQNAYPIINGAFTGEIGLEQLNEFNINKILIGHSERRLILNEFQEFIAKKFEFFKKHNFEIIYCIGETIEIRKKGIDEVIKYLKKELEGIDLEYEKLIVAYEPVWAIGRGVSASIDEIEEIHKEIKSIINRPLLYGGSVKVENIKEILQIKNVDGVLVGSASLDVNNFIKMIEIAKEIKCL